MPEQTLEEMLESDKRRLNLEDKPLIKPHEETKLLSEHGQYKSDLVNAMTVRLDPSEEETVRDRTDELFGEEKVYSKPIIDPKELDTTGPKQIQPSDFDWLDKTQAVMEFALTGNKYAIEGKFEKSKKDYWTPIKRNAEIFINHPITKKTFEILGYGENALIKGLRAAHGEEPFKNFTDNTWTNYFLDTHGMEKSKAKFLGFWLSIFGDPTTYVSLGAK